MDRNAIGQAGLTGWRTRVADAVAAPAARHTALSRDDVRTAVGLAFLVLSLVYVVGSMRRIARAS